MTIQFYIHLIAKRAKAIALLDSEATENFINLSYAKWLKLSIKQLPTPQTLLNVDGMENKSGKLQYYTDLNVQTGATKTTLHFFLSNLGEYKVILGYPWFSAMQPCIDWKRGWIDHTQLPIVFRASNAQKAIFVPCTQNVLKPLQPQDCYFMAKVTIGRLDTSSDADLSKVPKEFHQHAKVFSKQQSQRLPEHTVWDHTIKLLPRAPASLPGRLLHLPQNEIQEVYKIVAKHLKRGTIQPRIGPYAANVFFVKKKDGKLRPVQDYHPLNKWTKKNCNVSPLIPQVVD